MYHQNAIRSKTLINSTFNSVQNIKRNLNTSGLKRNDMFSSEFDINDVSINARNILTNGATQSEITSCSGCAISTRGRYMTATERSKNVNEKSLHLFIQGPNKHNIDVAIQKIEEIIRMDQMQGNQQKFRNSQSNFTTIIEKVYVGIENVLPGFDLRGKLIGTRGANLNYIRTETGAIVTIRGKGSMFIESNLGTESSEPLHLYIEHSKQDGLIAAKNLALNLVETLQQEIAQCQPQVIINPQIQPMSIYPQVPPPIALVQQNVPGMQFKVDGPPPQIVPPQLNIPPPGVHIPTQQGPLLTQQIHHQQQQQQMNVPTSVQNLPNNQQMLINQGQLMTSQQNHVTSQNNQTITSQNQHIQTRNIPQHLGTSHQIQNMQTEQQLHVIQENTIVSPASSQFHVPPPQQGVQQILNFNPNFTQQLVQSSQLQNQSQTPQMQIVQTGQPLHILSPQGLPLQNTQFIQQQLMNPLQNSTGTLQQIVPANSGGQVTFQIPIQGQHPFVQSPLLNSGQTQILLTQQNLQTPQNLHTITNMQGAQLFQQQNLQNQIPIVQGIPSSQSQYVGPNQVGIYSSQGLVLLQNNQGNQNMQITGLNQHQIITNTTQQENVQQVNVSTASQPATNIQMNLPIIQTYVPNQNVAGEQKSLNENEQQKNQPNIQKQKPNMQDNQINTYSLSTHSVLNNAQNATELQQANTQENQQNISLLQNIQVQQKTAQLFQTPQGLIHEHKSGTQLMLMQQVPIGEGQMLTNNINLVNLQTNQPIAPAVQQPNVQGQINYIQHSLQNPPVSQTQVQFHEQFMTAQTTQSTHQMYTQNVRHQQISQQEKKQIESGKQVGVDSGSRRASQEEEPRNKRRKCSDTPDTEDPSNQNVNKTGIGSEQMSGVPSSLASSVHQTAESKQQGSAAGSLPGNSNTPEADGCKIQTSEANYMVNTGKSWTNSKPGNQIEVHSIQSLGNMQNALEHFENQGFAPQHQQQINSQDTQVSQNHADFLVTSKLNEWNQGSHMVVRQRSDIIEPDRGNVQIRHKFPPNVRGQFDHRRAMHGQYQSGGHPYYMQNTRMPPPPPPARPQMQQFQGMGTGSNWFQQGQGGWM